MQNQAEEFPIERAQPREFDFNIADFGVDCGAHSVVLNQVRQFIGQSFKLGSDRGGRLPPEKHRSRPGDQVCPLIPIQTPPNSPQRDSLRRYSPDRWGQIIVRVENIARTENNSNRWPD